MHPPKHLYTIQSLQQRLPIYTLQHRHHRSLNYFAILHVRLRNIRRSHIRYPRKILSLVPSPHLILHLHLRLRNHLTESPE